MSRIHVFPMTLYGECEYIASIKSGMMAQIITYHIEILQRTRRNDCLQCERMVNSNHSFNQHMHRKYVRLKFECLRCALESNLGITLMNNHDNVNIENLDDLVTDKEDQVDGTVVLVKLPKIYETLESDQEFITELNIEERMSPLMPMVLWYLFLLTYSFLSVWSPPPGMSLLTTRTEPETSPFLQQQGKMSRLKSKLQTPIIFSTFISYEMI